jgi:hemerythrin-like metal-binding protein
MAAPPPFLWQPEYSVGHPLMDAHHRVLLDLCQALVDFQTVSRDENPDGLHLILIELSNYAKLHFKAEEELLGSIGFPHMAPHVAGHYQYQHNLNEFKVAAQLGTINLTAVIDYMTQWWVRHILYEDMQYSRFFRDQKQADQSGESDEADGALFFVSQFSLAAI